jgi:copper chaperone CopZ
MKKLLAAIVVVAAGATVYIWKTRGEPSYVAPVLAEQTTTPTTLVSQPAADECVRVLDIDGMCCGGCPPKVRKALAEVAGVREVAVDFQAKTASVIAPQSLAIAALERAATFDDYHAKARP